MSDSFHIMTGSGRIEFQCNTVICALNSCALNGYFGDLYQESYGNTLYVGKVLIQNECLYFAPVVDIGRFRERMFYFIRFTGEKE